MYYHLLPAFRFMSQKPLTCVALALVILVPVGWVVTAVPGSLIAMGVF